MLCVILPLFFDSVGIMSREVPNEVADQSKIGRQSVPDQSPTTAKPSGDSSVIVINFDHREVVER